MRYRLLFFCGRKLFYNLRQELLEAPFFVEKLKWIFLVDINLRSDMRAGITRLTAIYEAAQRGKYGKLAAKVLGNGKEVFDYFKNRYYKGMSYPDALADYWHDKDVNFQARELVDNPLYSNSKEACRYQRVEDINEKY